MAGKVKIEEVIDEVIIPSLRSGTFTNIAIFGTVTVFAFFFDLRLSVTYFNTYLAWMLFYGYTFSSGRGGKKK